jgi:hypothetical protein
MAQFLFLRKQADYLNKQAERFRRLARDSVDEGSGRNFLRLADEFTARASAGDTAVSHADLDDKGAA